MAKPRITKKLEATTWRERWAAVHNIPELIKMVAKTSPPLAATSVVLRLFKAFIPVAMVTVGKWIIDAAKDSDSVHIWRYVAYEIGIAVLSDLLGRGISLADSLLGDQFTNVVSIRLMSHASRLDLAAFEDPAFYDKLERARRQTTSRIGLLKDISGMAQDLITLSTLMAYLIYFSPWLMLLLVVAVIPAFLGEAHFAGLAYSLLYRKTPERRELDYVRMLGASVQSAKEVKIFGLGPYLTERYRAIARRFYDENRKLAIQRASVGLLLNLFSTAGYYGAYVVIIMRTLSRVITIGGLTALAASFAKSRSLIESLLDSVTSITDQALYLRDLYDFFAVEPSIVSKPGALPAPRPIRKGYEFRHVFFRYPGRPEYVLKNVSFQLDVNERIALIGENGSGKTTLVKLLSRMYDPESGQILLDGVDLRDYDVDDVRKEVGVIFQDFMKYDMLVRENIGLGRVEEMENNERIETASLKGMADSVIAQLPNGYDQMLGRRFENGSDLSGGQWQKIALARAYMRDAQVLILDEPTASLDARAEYEIFKRFADITRGKMAVLISHRFSTVRMADRILVLENGAVLEEGTHQQLVALGGRYAELFELQAAGYR